MPANPEIPPLLPPPDLPKVRQNRVDQYNERLEQYVMVDKTQLKLLFLGFFSCGLVFGMVLMFLMISRLI